MCSGLPCMRYSGLIVANGYVGLGAIMTKLGFEKERKGHKKQTGYYVWEHTQAEIEQMHHPEIF